MYFIEWVPDLKRRSGLLLPVEKVEKLVRLGMSGHTTLFQFDKAIADHTKENNNSKGLDKFPCSSRVLIMDNDHGEPGMIEMSAKLKALGLRHYIYNSGGKGYHFYVPLTERMTGVHVPYSHKRWVMDMGLGSLADTGIYHAGHLIAAPGRIHPKTGRKKAFVEEVPGEYLTVPYVEAEVILDGIVFAGEGNKLLMGISGLQDLIQQPEQGHRHTRVWSVSQVLAQAGMPQSTCEAVMIFLNSTWDCPKEEDDVIESVGQAYHQIGE